MTTPPPAPDSERRKPKLVVHTYRLGSEDQVTVPIHGRLLRRLGFRRAVTIQVAEVRRAAKGARRDRDAAIVHVVKHRL